MLIPLGIISSSGAAAFDPTSIADLVAWYDASDTSSISLSGSEVTQWNDLSGNAHHATQGTSTRRPLSGTRSLNGLNVLDFDGTDDFLINNGIASSFEGEDKPFTIFQVSQLDTAATGQTHWAITYNVNNTPRIFPAEANLNIRDDSGSAVALTITGALNTNAQFLTFRSSGLNFTGFLDDSLINTGTSYNLIDLTLSRGTIGAYRNDSLFPNGVLFSNGTIGELIFYNRELTLTEVEEVHSYLSAKWGI
jgi:hypothetical protein